VPRASKQRLVIPNLLDKTPTSGATGNIKYNTVYRFVWPRRQKFVLGLVTLALAKVSASTSWSWPLDQNFGLVRP